MSSFERKILENGQPNPKYIDLCDEDQPIAGQKFACLSFVSPEKILKKREIFLFDQFIKQWDFTKSLAKFFDFLHFLAYKYNLKIDDIVSDFNEFAKEEDSKLKENSTEDDYKNFLDKKEDELNAQFQREHAFQTSTRGLKVRGVYPTQEEAELRCKKLRELDPNHDIYVGPVGMWIPWDPDAYKTGRIEFMEEELNQLHKEKMKNEERAKQEFQNRIKETKKKAIEENIKLAEKTGNVLTQTMDEEGNLVGVKETVDFESREVANTETTNIRNELLRSTALNEKASE
jgi:flagellar biosynthesis/type III secretory pathway protein FliH